MAPLFVFFAPQSWSHFLAAKMSKGDGRRLGRRWKKRAEAAKSSFARDGLRPARSGGSRMSNSRRFAIVAALVVAASITTTARAETTPKSQGKAGAAVVLQITNSRSVALKELDATPSGLFIPKSILGALAPGKKTTAKLATDKDCVFDLHGAYADGSITESKGVDLCKDQNVNLVD
jgi:hypothetical protein